MSMIPNMLTILIPATVIILGWVVAHALTVRRDTIAKRRDLRAQYLLEAYRKLADFAGRDNALPEAKRAFESAVADIQLLGTPTQIDTLLVFLNEFVQDTNTSISPVLSLLRDEIRKELNLELKIPIVHQFRFHQ